MKKQVILACALTVVALVGCRQRTVVNEPAGASRPAGTNMLEMRAGTNKAINEPAGAQPTIISTNGASSSDSAYPKTGSQNNP